MENILSILQKGKSAALYVCPVLLLCSCCPPAFAQAGYNTSVLKDIIIIKSTKVSDSALSAAKTAAGTLKSKLDLRGLKPIAKTGLTASKQECHSGGGSDNFGYPCYWARGDGDTVNDDYISIEYSNAYKGFAKGYYIVVAAITDVKSQSMQQKLAFIQQQYPDAYAKRTFVWFGCMH